MKQYIVIDLEMNPVAKTNKDARKKLHREVIEIGAVKLNDDCSVIDKFRCYVRPQYNKEIMSFITDLTGISAYDTCTASDFSSALKKFENWVGYDDETIIYSWSTSDLVQIQKECKYKQIEIPANILNWVDFQALYTDVMGYSQEHKQLALHTAAEHFALQMDTKKTHSALYDAEVTTELLTAILTGEYEEQKELLHNTVLIEPEETGFSIGDCCGGILQQLLYQMNEERGAVPVR